MKDSMQSFDQPSGPDLPQLISLQEQALKQLAAELRRPPQSLAAFAHLSAEQLSWLATQVAAVCDHEDEKLNTALYQAIPWLLRPLLLRRLVKRGPVRSQP